MNYFKFFKSLIFAAGTMIFLSACGEEGTTEQITNNYSNSVEIVSTKSDLPKCNDETDGDQFWVKKEGTAYLCVDGQWNSLSGSSGNAESEIKAEVSCKTATLSDDSGIKIICNGDSIGVVLNGSAGKDGNDGKDGLGCEISETTDSSITMQCGEKTYNFDYNLGSKPENTEEEIYEACDESVDGTDSECSIEEADISGFSEKGPFLRGAAVLAYELLNGRTLKQTGKSFSGEIYADDGLFNIKSVKLSSQYAIIKVNGVYRNEVTGKNSDNSLELRALTNLKGRKNANVNLLTQLEYNRVSYLVTKRNVSVAMAKRQAKKEIMNAFNVDTTALNLDGMSEDLTIFGNTEQNAILLAISVLLQGDRTTADLKALLSKISDDIETDGEWNRDSLTRTAIATWALEKDASGFLSEIRSHVKGWNLGESVPEFEKYIRNFYQKELGLEECVGSREGFIKINSLKFVCENGNYRFAEVHEIFDNDCTADGVKATMHGIEYECQDGNWTIPGTLYIMMLDRRDDHLYKTIDYGEQVWMAENLNYRYLQRTSELDSSSFCYNNNLDSCGRYGRLYLWSAAMDSAGVAHKNAVASDCGYKYCESAETCVCSQESLQGICPDGWHLPSKVELSEVITNYADYNPLWLQATGFPGWPYAENSWQFSLYPAGFMGYVVSGNSELGINRYVVNEFYELGSAAYVWSSTEVDLFSSYFLNVDVDTGNVSNGKGDYRLSKRSAFSVRCIKD